MTKRRKLTTLVVVSIIGLTGGVAVAIRPSKQQPQAISLTKSVTKPVQAKNTPTQSVVTVPPTANVVPATTPATAVAPAPTYTPPPETQVRNACLNQKAATLASIQSEENEIQAELSSASPSDVANFNSRLATLQSQYQVTDARVC